MENGRHDLSSEVRQLLVERLKLDHIRPEDVDEEAPLFGQGGISGGLGLDSIDALELVLGIEQRFGVQVEDEETGTQALQSVATLCRFIEERRGTAPSNQPAGGRGSGGGVDPAGAGGARGENTTS